MTKKNWLVRSVPRPAAPLRIFCFPYAGAGASMYASWARQLPEQVEVIAIQLPGRESRFSEPLLDDVPTIVSAIAREMKPLLAQKPYLLFGHSLGAILAFEIARYIERMALICPLHLVVSGRQAPRSCVRDEPIHHLADEEFIEELRKLESTPNEVLSNEDLMAFLLPRIRADFAAAYDYRYERGPKVGFPVTAFGGTDDEDVGDQGLLDWEEECSGEFEALFFEGDHFFIHSAEKQVLDRIGRILDEALKTCRMGTIAHGA